MLMELVLEEERRDTLVEFWTLTSPTLVSWILELINIASTVASAEFVTNFDFGFS